VPARERTSRLFSGSKTLGNKCCTKAVFTIVTSAPVGHEFLQFSQENEGTGKFISVSKAETDGQISIIVITVKSIKEINN